MRTVADHEAAVSELIESIARGDPQMLSVLAERMASHPDDYQDRVLADDVLAPIDLPPFDNSQMDGYAVRANELAEAGADARVSLPIAATVAAGDTVGTLQPGTAAPIMTGAAIPVGADAVVPIERVHPPRFFLAERGSLTEDEVHEVSFTASVEAGTYVRTAGSDIAAGTVLLTAGTRLGPAQYGVLASAGVVDVPVVRRISVLLLSTGHELRQPGTPLGSGQIYDANTTVLTHALHDSGARVSAVRVPDRPDELLAVLASSNSEVDLVVTTGGVSAGAFEVVREALEPRGVQFDSVAMQPGGPQGLGRATVSTTENVTVPVVAFPGNPVSTLVSFEMFLRPALRRRVGLPVRRWSQWLPLATAVDSIASKHQVRRGVVNGAGMVELVGGPSSHLLHSYALSSVLVHLPVGLAHVDAGDAVEVWRIDD